MSGLLYKNFHINFFSFLFAVILAVICGIVNIVSAALIVPLSSDEQIIILSSILFCSVYFVFMLVSLIVNTIFQGDENKTCCAFALSVPQGGKGHIEAKYWYILIQFTTVMFIMFISDTIVFGITDRMVSLTKIIMLLFCIRLFLIAIEIPFLIRFGSQKGNAIKGLTIIFIIMLIMIYFLFGDISWILKGDNPIIALMEWLNNGKQILVISLFNPFSLLVYWLSCRISVRLFKKGAEDYEQ